MPVLTWSDTEIEQLLRFYPIVKGKDICNSIPTKTLLQIKSKANNLNLKKEFQRESWSDEKIEQLKALFPNNSTNEVAEIMQLSKYQVNYKSYALGLKKSDAYLIIMQEKTNIALLNSSINSRFTKGMVSHNKGRSIAEYMSPENIVKFKRAQFKKGHIPKNSKRIGAVRFSKDGFYEIKVRHQNGKINGAYEFLHRVIYEKHNGPIPEGMICGFKDFNKSNFEIKNIVLMTKIEHVKRVQLRDNYIARKHFAVKKEDVAGFLSENIVAVELVKKQLIIKNRINERIAENKR